MKIGNEDTAKYLNFELVRVFDYEFRKPLSKKEIHTTNGTAATWDEMVAVLDGIKPLQNHNVPIMATVERAVGLQNIHTGVLKKISFSEFNTSKSGVGLTARLSLFVCRGDKPVPTVRDIKEFVGGCSDCGSCDFCKNKLDLKDDAPAYFDMSCTPCIRPLDTSREIVIYEDVRTIRDARLYDFFTAPMNLKIVSPTIMVVNEDKGIVR